MDLCGETLPSTERQKAKTFEVGAGKRPDGQWEEKKRENGRRQRGEIER